jgi:hypothetical protein
MNEDEITVYVIYDHPKDHPEYFVVRRWVIQYGALYADLRHRCCETLEDARLLIPNTCHQLQSSFNDDPVILEVWF